MLKVILFEISQSFPLILILFELSWIFLRKKNKKPKLNQYKKTEHLNPKNIKTFFYFILLLSFFSSASAEEKISMENKNSFKNKISFQDKTSLEDNPSEKKVLTANKQIKKKTSLNFYQKIFSSNREEVFASVTIIWILLTMLFPKIEKHQK